MKTKQEVWDKYKATHLNYDESAFAAMEEYAKEVLNDYKLKLQNTNCTCDINYTYVNK